MEAKLAPMDDFVVDMALEVDSRGIDVEGLSRPIRLPGTEILHIAAHGRIWLTALVRAGGHEDAIRQMRAGVWSQLPEGPRRAARAEVSCVALGDLYARLESVLSDDELAELDIRDLVARTLWDRPPAVDLLLDEPAPHAPVGNTRSLGVRDSA